MRAFALAEAGVLEGRRVTTHWQCVDALRSRFPGILVEPDVLFVDDGDILTSAGSAAALDLGLHIIRQDHGAETANDVSFYAWSSPPTATTDSSSSWNARCLKYPTRPWLPSWPGPRNGSTPR